MLNLFIISFQKWLVGQVVTKRNIEEAKQFYKTHFGSAEIFNEEGIDLVGCHKKYSVYSTEAFLSFCSNTGP